MLHCAYVPCVVLRASIDGEWWVRGSGCGRGRWEGEWWKEKGNLGERVKG